MLCSNSDVPEALDTEQPQAYANVSAVRQPIKFLWQDNIKAAVMSRKVSSTGTKYLTITQLNAAAMPTESWSASTLEFEGIVWRLNAITFLTPSLHVIQNTTTRSLTQFPMQIIFLHQSRTNRTLVVSFLVRPYTTSSPFINGISDLIAQMGPRNQLNLTSGQLALSTFVNIEMSQLRPNYFAYQPAAASFGCFGLDTVWIGADQLLLMSDAHWTTFQSVLSPLVVPAKLFHNGADLLQPLHGFVPILTGLVWLTG